VRGAAWVAQFLVFSGQFSVLSRERGEKKAEALGRNKFAEKRDGNTPTGSGRAPVTEGRTQRAQRREKQEGWVAGKRLCHDPSAAQRHKAPLLRSG